MSDQKIQLCVLRNPSTT